MDFKKVISGVGSLLDKAVSSHLADWMVNPSKSTVSPEAATALTKASEEISSKSKNGFAAFSLSPDQTATPLSLSQVAQEVSAKIPKVLAEEDGLSSNSREVSNWVLSQKDHQEKPFVVADKQSGKMHFFGGDGKLIESVPALFGRVPGDTGEKHQTAAGRYQGDPYASEDYGDAVRFDRKENSSGGFNNALIHRVPFSSVTAPPKQRYLALDSLDPADNSQTSGCINLDPKAAKRLLPTFSKGGVVYVLPETEQGKTSFKGFSRVKLDQLTR